eukprot:scaffold49988_cov36-Tisochrysis_lutea.AAC.2
MSLDGLLLRHPSAARHILRQGRPTMTTGGLKIVKVCCQAPSQQGEHCSEPLVCALTWLGTRGLNGDILVWNPVTRRRHELSSMGIRVDGETLRLQMEGVGRAAELVSPYHQSVLSGSLPLSIGGGIGQVRVAIRNVYSIATFVSTFHG